MLNIPVSYFDWYWKFAPTALQNEKYRIAAEAAPSPLFWLEQMIISSQMPF